MPHVEELGFTVMVGYEAKLTMAEGVVLGAGAILAFAASHLASKSLSETRVDPIELAKELMKDDDVVQVIAVDDQELQERLRTKGLGSWKPWEIEDRFRGVADFMLDTGASKQEIMKLLQAGGGTFLRKSHPSVLLTQKEKRGLRNLATLPEDAVKDVIFKLIDRVQDDEFEHIEYLGYLGNLDEDVLGSLYRLVGQDPAAANTVKKIATLAAPLWNESVLSGISGEDRETLQDMGFLRRRIDWSDPSALPALQSILKRENRGEEEFLLSLIGDTNDLVGAGSLHGLPITLDAYSYRLVPKYMGKYEEKVQWDKFKKNLEDFQQIPHDLYEKAKIPKGYTLAVWRHAQESDAVKKSVFLASAIFEAIPSEKLQEVLMHKWANVADFGKDSVQLATFEKLSKAFKSGLLSKFNDVCWDKGTWWYGKKLNSLLKHQDLIKDFKTCGELAEQLDIIDGSSSSDDSYGAMRVYSQKEKAVRRARDRLARRDPEWAIAQHPDEYKRGRRIARLLEQLVDHVESLIDQGDTVVVHGRDGELLYDLLMRRPGIDKSKVRYAITSRPVTTWASTTPLTEHHRRELERYYDYLGRLIPTGAVHVDTGFEGSIPRWLDQQGFEVKSIAMVSANRLEEEIPITLPISREQRRDIVLSDLEHSSQRFDVLEKYNPKTGAGGFGGMVYSLAAPGYHARAYGVYDELGLPRLRQKTPETRFEARSRYRIAAEKPSDEPDAIMEEETVLKVK